MARARLRETYDNELVAKMTEKSGYRNPIQVPELDRIVIDMGIDEAKENAKVLEAATRDLEIIVGQKAVITKSKKSVASFKIREDMPIGCKMTLRSEKMYEFADRLVSLALPCVRDFKGVNPNSFDGRGSYTVGIKERPIFPEIEHDRIDKVHGMNIIFVTMAQTDGEAHYLLTLFNIPFTK